MATINSCNMQITPNSAGSIFYPVQPGFLAYASSPVLNVTGDGTVATIAFGTELIDKRGNFSSPTFTAPNTGKYLISATVYCQQLGAGNTSCKVNIVTTTRTYLGLNVSGAIRDGNNNWQSGSVSTLVDMIASDTATITFTVSGGTKIVDIGAFQFYTNFSARLVG